MTYFHFTHAFHLPRILATGYLKTTESNIGSPFPVPFGPHGERVGPDVVWLFDTPEPEWANDKAHGLYPDKRRIRFEVDVKAVRWLDWAPAKQMAPEWRELFLQGAGGLEAAERWYVLPSPIYRKRWVDIIDTTTGKSLKDEMP